MGCIRRSVSAFAGTLAVLLNVAPVAAEALRPYSPPHHPLPAGLILIVGEGKVGAISIAEIERLPMVELTTTSLTDSDPVDYQGVLLSDFIHHIGAARAERITVRAEDHYSAVVPKEDWTRYAVLLATRIDGHPLSRRDRGPARIIYPIDHHPELADPPFAYRGVWLISEINW